MTTSQKTLNPSLRPSKQHTNMLTDKQERFAQLIAMGYTQVDAYCEAYEPKEGKRKTVWENASRLVSNSKVSARINDLRNELSQKYLWTREQSIKALAGVLKNDPTNHEAVAAIRELNAMHGWHESKTTNKHEVTGGNITISTGVPEPDAD